MSTTAHSPSLFCAKLRIPDGRFMCVGLPSETGGRPQLRCRFVTKGGFIDLHAHAYWRLL
jgi:hypothetical protein